MMDRSCRGNKPTFEKENQQKFVNKRTDLLASLHNIKLPLQHSQSLKDNQFQSVPLTASLATEQPIDQIHSYREHKFTKFSSKQITLTEQYCKTYGTQVQNVLRREPVKGKFLANHKIDGVLRARMLDWMVEVMSSYHFHNKTYFAGVQIMDRFFQSCSQVLVPTQLHIIGVQSMFIATKMEEVYPLKMKTVYQKIAHKKISILQLSQMENKIAQGLDFCLVSASIYDLALTKIARHLTDTDSYSEIVMKDIEQFCGCVAKFIYYNYELISSFDKDVIAQALANFALQSYKLERYCRVTALEQQCRQIINETISSFKRKYKGLNNVFKFTDKKVLDKIQIPL